MFKKHRSPVQGQKSKLMAFVAYALAGLLASGSAYAVDDTEFNTVRDTVNKHEAYLKLAQPKLEELNNKYLPLLKDVEKDYPAYKAKFDAAVIVLDKKADKTALDTKAEKAYVDEIALNYGKALVDLKENKADKTALDSKAEKAYVDEIALNYGKALVDLKENKADKKAVDDQFNEVDKFLRTTEKYLEYVDKEVFDENNPDSLVNRVDTNEKAIADKADKTALDAKADKTELDKKADVSKLNEIALNYGKALVDLKENKLDKADLANFEADAAKVKKAAAQISNKADRSEVVRLGNAVNADLTAVKNALNTKANQADLEKVDARVTKVESVVEAQGTAIQSLNNRISGFGSQISDLHNKMEKLEDNVESGLAIQSAHAALFQPYRVGHVNVTAGLGGYKSKTALAVGVGYRFNERVAAKAGVAADTKGKRASYNLGVNFEF